MRRRLFDIAFLTACGLGGFAGGRVLAPILFHNEVVELRRDREELRRLQAEIRRLREGAEAVQPVTGGRG